jgi:phosphoribulokinase
MYKDIVIQSEKTHDDSISVKIDLKGIGITIKFYPTVKGSESKAVQEITTMTKNALKNHFNKTTLEALLEELKSEHEYQYKEHEISIKAAFDSSIDTSHFSYTQMELYKSTQKFVRKLRNQHVRSIINDNFSNAILSTIHFERKK